MEPSRQQSKSPDSSRKRPGSACTECRRRKLRCDGKQPQCENCFIAGVPCVVSPPAARRGPKKGHIKTLQTRIANLESRLNGTNGVDLHEVPTTNDPETQPFEVFTDPFQTGLPEQDIFIPPANIPMLTSPGIDPLSSIPSWDLSPTISGSEISDLMKEDLDQLFFDRVHVFVPILHQNRYLSWSRDSVKSPAKQGLQYAMWAMAASMSAQLEHLRDYLYQQAIQLLESPEANQVGDDYCQIEHVQAWLMVTFYEFSRLTYHRGWMSAGKCFRLVQLMHLHEVDRSDRCTARSPGEEGTEEKRRVFWMAYVLDRFISVRADHPLTFSEPVIVTRLPTPDDAFQNGRCAEPSGFLPESFASIDTRTRCPLHDYIVLATLCGRTLSHRQQTAAEHSSEGLTNVFLERHQSLESLLARSALSIAQPSMPRQQPIHLFNTLIAQAAILYHCRTLEAVVGQSDTGFQAIIAQSRQQALSSALEIARLARIVSSLSYFKVHPFTPLPLILCAEFLREHQEVDSSASLQLQEIQRILEGLTSISNFRHAWKIEL